jgi:carbon-monoxide dehydrogenase medium subunit
VKPAAFEYYAPDSLDEGLALLADFGDDAKVLAGGQSLIPLLSMRLATIGNLIDIGRIDELVGVREVGAAVEIGATTLSATVERTASLASTVPLLARSTPLIGHFQIRNRGTVGGSIAHADPAAEYPTVALTLDAELEVASVRGRRQIPAAEFFNGFWSTALEPDEVLTSIRFPVWEGRCGFAVREFARRFGDFALAGAMVAVRVDDDDRVDRCAIGLMGLAPTPIRATAAEHAALGESATLDADQVGRLAVAGLSEVPGDHHGDAAYRLRVGAHMVSQAWRAATEEALA